MRYRKLDAAGDYTFGHGAADFLVDSPACVEQKILTRLKLWTGEWFLDTTSGTPWLTDVLSAAVKNTTSLYDFAIRSRVLETDGATDIAEYTSSLDGARRQLTVQMTVNTQFGQTGNITAVLSLPSGG